MIRKKYIAKLKREMWGFDIRLDDGTGRRSKRVRAFTFETKRQAEEALAIIRRREKEQKFGLAPQVRRPRLVHLLDARVKTIEHRSERIRAERVFREWLAVLPEGIRVDELGTPELRLFVEKRQTDGLVNSSVNRELNIIAAALNSAGQYFPELSQWRAPKLPRPKVSKSRRERLITDDEYRSIVAWLTRPPDQKDGQRAHDQQSAYQARLRVAAVFRFAMLTGMRPGEIYALRWEDVQLDVSRIRVQGTKTEMKTNSTRYVPLTAPAREILEQQRGHAQDREYVFTKGGNPTPKIYRILRMASEACGIAYGRKTQAGLELYCARHTFTTRLLQSGLDLRTVGDITGHTDRELVLHYSHVTPESTKRAISAIESIEAGRI